MLQRKLIIQQQLEKMSLVDMNREGGCVIMQDRN